MALTFSTTFINSTKLHELLANAVAQTQQKGLPKLISYCQPVYVNDALDSYIQAAELLEDAFYWEQPDQQTALVGAGAALILTANGENRFNEVRQQWQNWLSQAEIYSDGAEPNDDALRLFGGFAFRPQVEKNSPWANFGAARFVLPEVQLSTEAGKHLLTINVVVTPGFEVEIELERLLSIATKILTPVEFRPVAPLPEIKVLETMPPRQWMELVSRATRQIRAGKFEKVVLAREVQLISQTRYDVNAAISRLREKFPQAAIFAVKIGNQTFLGATPERLVHLAGNQVTTMALAGSIRRGKTEQEDDALGRELLSSAKNLEEHAIVVKMLREALAPFCDNVYTDAEPELLKLSNIQHLHTLVTGKLKAGQEPDILKLVDSLHPTPALGGYPRREALDWLYANEGLDRGWYAAPLGWLNAKLEGEFAVALRSGLVERTTEADVARLYGGCGIVVDSNPETEYSESWVKLRAVSNALGLQ